MHFGTFMEFGTRPDVSHSEAFREGFDHAKLCEDVGLDSVWLSEFHFMPDRSVLSSSRFPEVSSATGSGGTLSCSRPAMRREPHTDPALVCICP